jgi:predicted DNA-binding transcriptional regulator YafY
MRADRLLSIVLLLQVRERMTARELAERLEVSERTVYRDLDALSAAGVPVYAEGGHGGGCRLPEGYRTALTGLTAPEVRALYAPSPAGPLADLGLGDALERTLLKLLATLPPAHRGDAQRARERVHLDARKWGNPGETFPRLPTLQDAVWRERKLRLTYGRRDREPRERVVEPYGLVAKAGVWYLVGAADDEMRVYRVSRVSSVEIMDERFDRDEGFDLPAFWGDWSDRFIESLRGYQTTVRVAADFLPGLPRVLGEDVRAAIERAESPDGEGRVRLELEFESSLVARSRLLGCGDKVEALEPEELRKGMAAIAARIGALYRT